tara:strand:+ start:1210 stop:1545 length:336 start_codon:yes stop_codon:yes gene_type:complete
MNDMKLTRTDRAAVSRKLFVLLLATLLAGCGSRSSGPQRYNISGAVTWGGKPVPAGRIIFEPDPSQGNKGPAAYMDIQDGRFVNQRGKGTVGGNLIVRILGNDGIPVAELP